MPAPRPRSRRPTTAGVRRRAAGLGRDAAAFLRREDGPTSVEYAVMLGLILATIFASIGMVGGTTAGLFQNAEDELEAAGFFD